MLETNAAVGRKDRLTVTRVANLLGRESYGGGYDAARRYATCLISFDRNRYSVAARAAHRAVHIRAYADRRCCQRKRLWLRFAPAASEVRPATIT